MELLDRRYRSTPWNEGSIASGAFPVMSCLRKCDNQHRAVDSPVRYLRWKRAETSSHQTLLRQETPSCEWHHNRPRMSKHEDCRFDAQNDAASYGTEKSILRHAAVHRTSRRPLSGRVE